jgi:hypothetical protein
MAIELLLYAPLHRAIHDAESLVYVLLFLCSHLDGPGSVGDPPLFGSGSKHPSGISSWLSANSLNMLGHAKFSQMTAHINVDILPHLSTYFKPLSPHIFKLWTTLFPSTSILPKDSDASHSVATLRDLINTFKEILLDKDLITKASAAGSVRKRSHPGELIISGNGWDAIPASKKQMTVKTTPTRRKSFMRKCHKRGH